jgi:hypothetical protein
MVRPAANVHVAQSYELSDFAFIETSAGVVAIDVGTRPASGVLFAGDVLMPYVGVPFFAEGPPQGLLETLRFIRQLAPQQLIEGHTTLTENFIIEAVPGMEPALSALYQVTLASIGNNMALPYILDLVLSQPRCSTTPRRSSVPGHPRQLHRPPPSAADRILAA